MPLDTPLWPTLADSRRRDFLRRLAWATAAGGLPAGAWAAQRLHSQPFAWGVASSSPHNDGMVLWTRLAPAALPAPSGLATVRWELAHDEHFRRPVRSGQATALPELGHSVHVELTGLPSDRWYFYRFTLGDATSPTGRTRTLAAPGAQVQHFRFAFASCQRWEHGYYAAWRHLCAEQPDAVVFLGDYIYEYASDRTPAAALARSHTLRHARSLADYRDRYALHRSDPALQAAHALCPWIVTWDDHEVENDYAGVQGQEDPLDFLLRRAAAYQAFYENMPLRASALVHGLAGLGRPDAVRVNDRVAHGQLLRFHVLDSRQYRDFQACRAPASTGSGSLAPKDCPELTAPGRSLLGTAQESWLQQGLAQDVANAATGGPRWTVLAQQTLFSQRNYRAAPNALYSTDSWDGYPADRQRLLNTLAQQPPRNTVFIGGDIHQNYVCRVLADYQRPESATIASEFCGTSVTSRSNTTQDKVDGVARRNPHVLLANCEYRGYGLVDVTPTTWTTRLQVLDDVTRPDAQISTLARFVVEDGRPGPVRDT